MAKAQREQRLEWWVQGTAYCVANLRAVQAKAVNMRLLWHEPLFYKEWELFGTKGL